MEQGDNRLDSDGREQQGHRLDSDGTELEITEGTRHTTPKSCEITLYAFVPSVTQWFQEVQYWTISNLCESTLQNRGPYFH